MAQTIRIKGDNLKWARRTCGLTTEDACQLLRVPPGDIADWEQNGHDFTLTKLRELAKKYKRPLTVLLRSEVPPVPEPPEDFRTIEGRPSELSRLAVVAIRDARRIQAIASYIADLDRTLIPPLSVTQAEWRTDSAIEQALIERRSLGISLDTQLRWHSPNEALNAWRARIQLRGVLVLVKPMDAKDCRGFSLYQPGQMPIIVANALEVDQAKIFTMAHEYAHIMLRRSGICLEQEGQTSERQRIEAWCNSFAGNLLVPEDELNTLLIPGVPIDRVVVHSLAQRFEVSRAVIAIRFKTMGLVSDAFVDEFTSSPGEVWRQKPVKEEDDEETEEDGFGRYQEDIRVTEVGFAFPKIVLGALRHGLVTVKEASEYLDVRADNFAALADRIDSIAKRHF